MIKTMINKKSFEEFWRKWDCQKMLILSVNCCQFYWNLTGCACPKPKAGEESELSSHLNNNNNKKKNQSSLHASLKSARNIFYWSFCIKFLILLFIFNFVFFASEEAYLLTTLSMYGMVQEVEQRFYVSLVILWFFYLSSSKPVSWISLGFVFIRVANLVANNWR